jgi:hypothetical protein
LLSIIRESLIVQCDGWLRKITDSIRFVAKFDASLPVSAVMAIEKGCRADYGLSVFFQQEKRRCLIVDTIIGACSDEDAFWYTMLLWASFQPRFASPRSEPGQLYYPAAATHVIEKYWDYLNDSLTHPDSNESEFTRKSMHYYANALRSMDLCSFEPLVDSEAPDKACRIATIAAASRRLPIQDARDFWEPPGNAPEECGTDSGGPAPSQDSHNVDT